MRINKPKDIISATVKHLPTITKLLVILVTSALIPLMFPNEGKSEHYDYTEGGIWRNSDLVAPFDFDVVRTQAEIDQEIAASNACMTLYYHTDSSAYATAQDRLGRLAAQHSAINLQQCRKTLDSIYHYGYLEVPDSITDIGECTLVLLEGQTGYMHAATDFVQPIDVRDTLLRDYVLVPSITYDENLTLLERESRMSQIAIASDRVEMGELIINKGEQVSKDKAQVIRSLEAENDRRFAEQYSPFGRFLGQFVLCLIAFFALFMFLENTRHPLLEDTRKVIFVMTLVLLVSAITALVVYENPAWVLIVPICIIPIMMRIFFDMRVALYVHVTTLVILANMVPNPFEFIFYQLIAGMLSIVTVRNFESRSKFFIVSGVIFLCYAMIYTFGVLSQQSNLESITAERYLIFFLSALLTLMAYPLIYLFERIFGLTTNLTLMEISSTNTPALRDLSRTAPGTFQHCIQVANISEDIISEIGGNSLLAKVGALYHDIGKIQAPLYFTENQTGDFNPHNELEYTESAAIIIQHVRDGISLAKKYRLPMQVQDFIRTHHGTTVTGYFYARQKAEHPDSVNINDFRYPGPMPFSRETAVVMVVDSVEAACKSLKEHDKESIDRLVDNILDGKINERQFQNCDLTMHDLTTLRQLLKDKMRSIYHARVAYPVAK